MIIKWVWTQKIELAENARKLQRAHWKQVTYCTASRLIQSRLWIYNPCLPKNPYLINRNSRALVPGLIFDITNPFDKWCHTLQPDNQDIAKTKSAPALALPLSWLKAALRPPQGNMNCSPLTVDGGVAHLGKWLIFFNCEVKTSDTSKGFFASTVPPGDPTECTIERWVVFLLENNIFFSLSCLISLF